MGESQGLSLLKDNLVQIRQEFNQLEQAIQQALMQLSQPDEYNQSDQNNQMDSDDNVLIFVKSHSDNKFIVLGGPALDPFKKGFKSMRNFAKYCIQEGASPDTQVAVAGYGLGTLTESKIIGKLEDWYNDSV